MTKCIICDRSDTLSKEHIIPESLGNSKFCTECVCMSCNNKLGSNIDSYITNYPLIKLIRKDKNITGKGGKPVKVFNSSEISVSGKKYLFNDDMPTIAPTIKFDDGTLSITAKDINEALNLARKRLKKEGLSDDEISKALLNIKKQGTDGEQPQFNINSDIHINRLLIFAIKIAYEYAHKTIGNQYLDDEIAMEFRKMIFKTINVPKDEVLQTVNAFEIKNAQWLIGNCDFLSQINAINKMQPPIMHLIHIFSNEENEIICAIYLFLIDIFSFNVRISQNASKYGMKNLSKFAAILEDGEYISF